MDRLASVFDDITAGFNTVIDAIKEVFLSLQKALEDMGFDFSGDSSSTWLKVS